MSRIGNFLSGKRIDATTPPPYLLHLRSSRGFILTTICIAVATDTFLYGMIVPVIPFALASRAGVTQSSLQKWTSILLGVYGAALFVCSPLAGFYADRSSSRRLPLLVGLLALAGATLMLCLARNISLLVIGRLLQGASASIVWTVGLALLVDTVGQNEIGESLGWTSISMSVSILGAPLLGGVVYQKAGYYAVYYMAFGLIALDILFRLLLVEKKIALQWLPEEVEISTSEQGFDPEKMAEEKAGKAQEQPPLSIPASKYAPVFTLLKSRRLLASLWACVVQMGQLTAFDGVVPLFVKDTFHWDSTGAGLIFLAVIIPTFASPLVGWASDKYGPRWLTVSGFVLAIPFWVLLRLVTHDSLGQKVLFCALLSLIGVALTLAMPSLMAEITYVVEEKEREVPGRFGKTGAYAQAYGFFVTAIAAGTLIGPVWAGYVRTDAGWGTMSWSLGLFGVSAAIPCLIWTGGLITEKNAKTGEERAAGRSIEHQRVNNRDNAA
ncbi:MFS transporter-like protein [Hyaloscypha variabilis]